MHSSLRPKSAKQFQGIHGFARIVGWGCGEANPMLSWAGTSWTHEQSHTVTRTTEDQKDTSNPTIWPLTGIPCNKWRLKGKFQSSHWAHPAKGALQIPQKTFTELQLGILSLIWGIFLFPPRYLNLVISQNPSTQRGFGVPAELQSETWTPSVNPMGSWSCAAAPGGLWHPHSPSLLHWDWPQRPQNLPNTEIIIVQMLAKWSERSWGQDPNTETPLFSSLSLPALRLSSWTTPVITTGTHKSAQQTNYYYC